RCSIVWTACKIGGDSALRVIEKGFSDSNIDVRTAAARASGRLKSKRPVDSLIALLSDPSLSVRREAATALGEIGDPRAVQPLIDSATTLDHRFLDHATIFALIQLGQADPLLAALDSKSSHGQRVALAALQQVDSNAIPGAKVAPFLASEEDGLRKKALWVASHHPEWAEQLAGFFSTQLEKEELTEMEEAGLREALLGFSKSDEIQTLFSKLLEGDEIAASRKRILIDTMAQSSMKDLPEIWIASLGGLALDVDTDQSVRSEALRLLQSRGIAAHDGGIRSAAMDSNESPDYRVALLSTAVARNPQLSDAEFDFLVSRLNPELDSTSRLTTAQVLGKADLTEEQLLEISENHLATADALLLPALSGAFAGGSNPKVGKSLISALLQSEVRMNFLANGKLDELLEGYPQSVRDLAAPLHQRLLDEEAQRGEKMKEFEPLIAGGDVGRGRRIFFGKTAACYTCHSVGLEGGELGPDLTMIGAIRQGRDLLEAILFPSASFVPDYETFRL
ncbi:MAG: HEAT repeat domain-containing protein, partial [Candidatus Omnitrophica bacterium]|nr:HEAT repeat domain-containing protein [Candidatus Omnitrophota bacterium]